MGGCTQVPPKMGGGLMRGRRPREKGHPPLSLFLAPSLSPEKYSVTAAHLHLLILGKVTLIRVIVLKLHRALSRSKFTVYDNGKIYYWKLLYWI